MAARPGKAAVAAGPCTSNWRVIGVSSRTFSIIVPVLNEASGLSQLAAHLAPFSQAGAQVLLVDGGSDDGTLELAERAGIPRIVFAEAFDSAAQRAATAADFSWTQDLGIAGFPTLLAERNRQLALLTNGYQPLDVLQPLLTRWLERVAHA